MNIMRGWLSIPFWATRESSDVSKARVQHLSQAFQGTPNARFTACREDLAAATHFLIAVPTLLLPDRRVDASTLSAAVDSVAAYARPGSVVVTESSVAVGMTRRLLEPLARSRGVFAGMSPERVDQGRASPPAKSIPKVVSGLDDVVAGSGAAVARLYAVVPVSRPEVAEMTKLYENCQRMVCIAYANEMADACLARHGIDPFEVARAAATKPFGYMPVTPGVGVGGHCIPVNPWYLLSSSSFPILRDATERMAARPAMLARRVVGKLGGAERQGRARVLVVGAGFKAGQAHVVNSAGLELAKGLVLSSKVDVMWADPLVQQEAVPQIPRLADEDWNVDYLQQSFDMIIVASKQDKLDAVVLDLVRDVLIERWHL